MNLQEEFYNRIDNDSGYDNQKLGDDLIEIAKKHLSKQFDISGVSKRFIPKGWYVHEAGQNPLHMLWFVVLINFDDVANNIKNPRYFVAEECDSFEEALQECAKNVC